MQLASFVQHLLPRSMGQEGRRTAWAPLLAIAVSLSSVFKFFLVAPSPARAADTTVSCVDPQFYLTAGHGNATQPRFEIDCPGGSNVGIKIFSFLISSNPTLALLFERAAAGWVLENGTHSTILLGSNLADTSGNAWGCGAANCRILDGLIGY